MVYLDYAASTPVEKDVLDIFYNVTNKYYANPNSIHKLGQDAKEKIEEATKNIAQNLNVLEEEIIYTSGASEANNLAIKGVCERYKNRGKHIILSSLEHNSIIAPATLMQEQGFEVDLIPIKKDGIVDMDELKKLIREDTILISIASVDSELGIKQPIEEIGAFLKKYPNVIFHTDASQIIGKEKIDFKDVDLVTITPHKFYGLPGSGILIKKKAIHLKPIINGGKSTTVFRSGTPVLAEIISMDKALSLALQNLEKRLSYIKCLNQIVIDKLSKYDKVYINSTKNSIPHIINISIKKVKSFEVAKMLEEREIYISTKTSCCPVETPSKLVYALTNDKSLALSSLRISISHLTTHKEIDEFLKAFDEVYKELEKSGKI